MKRPSQFMLLFLLLVATPLFVWCEQPAPGKSRPGRVINRGRGDMPAAARSDTEARQPAAAPVTGVWTLFGTVYREAEPGGERQMPGAPIGLELVPLSAGRTTGLSLLSTSVDAKSCFRMEGLHPGKYRVRALPERESAAFLPVAVDVALPATSLEKAAKAQSMRQDLTLPYPRALNGTLRRKDNTPRCGLTVSVSETGIHRGTAVSDQEGAFRIEGVGAGPYEILVRTEAGAPLPVEIEAVPQAADKSAVGVAVVVP
jgi:hypothetical protein